MNHIAQNVSIEVDGKTYILSRFTRGLLSKFLDWAESVMPHPLEVIKNHLQGLTTEQQNMLIREAVSRARLRRDVNSPDIQTLFNSPEGAMKVIQLMLNVKHPEITYEQAGDIFDRCNYEHGDEYLRDKIADATGHLPDDKAGVSEKKV